MMTNAASPSVTTAEDNDKLLALRRSNDNAARLDLPEGWFQVGYSDEIEPGQLISLRYFARDLVMFRTESGKVQVLDAYCAHLGAHLGVGGQVVGERLRCPFHAWEYAVTGVCEAVPYSKHLPKAAVATWPTVERAGLILVWYSPVANPPLWDAPDMPEFGDANWQGYTREKFTVHTTAQEIVENIFDIAHAPYVHGNGGGGSLPTADFSFDDAVAVADLRIDLPSIGASTANIVTMFGLGLNITRSVGLGSKCFWTTNTPIDQSTLEIRFSMLTAVSTPTDPTGENSKHSAAATTVEFAKDIPIWEHKIYRQTPTLCAGDGPIGRFRLWAQQFYPQTV